MKKIIILQILLSLSLFADITLSAEEEKNWQIKTVVGKEVTHIPLGEYIMKVTTPPKLLHTLSVPYEAQIVNLNRVNFEKVDKGEPLALLTATEWIEAQRKAIADTIELMHHEHLAERKAKLCQEEIIAQKECLVAEAEVKTDKIKLSASKTLLKAYGASESMIKKVYTDLVILPNMQLLSPVKGTLLEVNIQPGKSVSPSSALFVIKVDGENWLESDIPQAVAKNLKSAQEVIITVNGKDIQSKVLNVSPVINPHNQTRYVRFSLPQEANLLSGLRQKVQLNIKEKAFIVNKKAVVQDGDRNLVFIKDGQKYKAQEVNVIAENAESCYLDYNIALNGSIVISSTSIFQNMLKEGE
ncbi:efflux RND transporter periplasmic adaptor subunit [Sulfurimonas sp.]|uniref:efflux RND transporter periplasmic adaptor subunit n=1 Tax=Sulfurimonas sp. TaxID=2022749 RepID=UPI0026220C07|nr:efflux RND transporter periplasmic adaptor subunit [Sulfurimonas sp.]MCW8895178.1 efflux RND transporter periplasmic adaptor subunit [Sulfurimonas sp.]